MAGMARPSESARARTNNRLDRFAIALSSLCLVHCVATVVLAATLASLGAALANPIWHEAGFTLAILIGAVALGRGYAAHRDLRPLLLGGSGLALMAVGLVRAEGLPEILCTMVGVVLLAVAHRMNARCQCGGHGHDHDLAGEHRHA
jgi:hypothetical protein